MFQRDYESFDEHHTNLTDSKNKKKSEMLKVKIEERYLKSFEWFLQCYQYLFYYDSGAEVSCNIFPPAGT